MSNMLLTDTQCMWIALTLVGWLVIAVAVGTVVGRAIATANGPSDE